MYIIFSNVQSFEQEVKKNGFRSNQTSHKLREVSQFT